MRNTKIKMLILTMGAIVTAGALAPGKAVAVDEMDVPCAFDQGLYFSQLEADANEMFRTDVTELPEDEMYQKYAALYEAIQQSYQVGLYACDDEGCVERVWDDLDEQDRQRIEKMVAAAQGIGSELDLESMSLAELLGKRDQLVPRWQYIQPMLGWMKRLLGGEYGGTIEEMIAQLRSAGRLLRPTSIIHFGRLAMEWGPEGKTMVLDSRTCRIMGHVTSRVDLAWFSKRTGFDYVFKEPQGFLDDNGVWRSGKSIWAFLSLAEQTKAQEIGKSYAALEYVRGLEIYRQDDELRQMVEYLLSGLENSATSEMAYFRRFNLGVDWAALSPDEVVDVIRNFTATEEFGKLQEAWDGREAYTEESYAKLLAAAEYYWPGLMDGLDDAKAGEEIEAPGAPDTGRLKGNGGEALDFGKGWVLALGGLAAMGGLMMVVKLWRRKM